MIDRQFLIEELTKYELECFLDNPEYLEENVYFFARGGFNAWTDEALQKKYDLFIAEAV
jgi:hypothetical protein